MLDAALIEKCADPSLKPTIVERFVDSISLNDPLAITVKAGDRLILVPKPKTQDEAMDTVRRYAGQAIVRVGLTQLPAGVAARETSELKPDLVDPCENLRAGTKMFAKVMRIVAKWYGNPTDKEVLPQVFEDAVYAWRTGRFEGIDVFRVEEPDETASREVAAPPDQATVEDSISADASPGEDKKSLGNASMRIDLSRIGR